MAQSQRLGQYISDDEDDNDMELESSSNNGNVQEQKRQNRRKWIPICTYNNKDDAINKIKSEGTWSINYSNVTSDGKRVYYRCNQVKRRGRQCPANIHVLYHIENECATIYENYNNE